MVTDTEFALFLVRECCTGGPFVSDPFSAELLP
jgi:hypothetical protein